MTKHVLLLEDDLGLRTSLRLVLEDDGYEVTEAGDVESALSIVEETRVDVMLVDLMLGGVDGFTFIRRARPISQAPIVVVSARDGVQDIVSALEAGADDYVTKPFDVAEVQARLRAMLRRPALDSGTDHGRQRLARLVEARGVPPSAAVHVHRRSGWWRHRAQRLAHRGPRGGQAVAHQGRVGVRLAQRRSLTLVQEQVPRGHVGAQRQRHRDQQGTQREGRRDRGPESWADVCPPHRASSR